MRALPLLALALLAACAGPKYEIAEEAPVAVEPVVVEPEASAGLTDPDCQPGDDDGIGGTGCKID